MSFLYPCHHHTPSSWVEGQGENGDWGLEIGDCAEFVEALGITRPIDAQGLRLSLKIRNCNPNFQG